MQFAFLRDILQKLCDKIPSQFLPSLIIWNPNLTLRPLKIRKNFEMCVHAIVPYHSQRSKLILVLHLCWRSTDFVRLFKDAFSIETIIMVGWWMNDGELKVVRKEAVIELKYCPWICIEGLRKFAKTSGLLVSRPRFEPNTVRIQVVERYLWINLFDRMSSSGPVGRYCIHMRML
jgi:hypothetical protein